MTLLYLDPDTIVINRFTGSAASATVKYTVTGGRYQ